MIKIRICKCGKICYSDEDFEDHLEEDGCQYSFYSFFDKVSAMCEELDKKLMQQKRELLKLKKIDTSKIPDDKFDFFVMMTCIIYKPTLKDILCKLNGDPYFENKFGFKPFELFKIKIWKN